MNVVELESVSKRYGSRQIIDKLSLSIPEHSIVAITGKSGAGKSTILNMIGLLESVDNGIIKLFGKKLPSINSAKATRMRRSVINYLFQSCALINDITVLDNLLIAMQFVNKSQKEKIQLMDNVLQALDISFLRDEKIHTLSGGEQQRVALARCILKPGDLILADEPTGSLDPNMAQTVFDLIKKLRDDYHKTIVVVTHDMSIANQSDVIVELGTSVTTEY